MQTSRLAGLALVLLSILLFLTGGFIFPVGFGKGALVEPISQAVPALYAVLSLSFLIWIKNGLKLTALVSGISTIISLILAVFYPGEFLLDFIITLAQLALFLASCKAYRDKTKELSRRKFSPLDYPVFG